MSKHYCREGVGMGVRPGGILACNDRADVASLVSTYNAKRHEINGDLFVKIFCAAFGISPRKHNSEIQPLTGVMVCR